jgi:hypothetical protein
MRNFTKSSTVTDFGKQDSRVNIKLTGFGAQSIIDIDEILAKINRLPTFHLERLKEIAYDPNRLIGAGVNNGLESPCRHTKGKFILSHRTIVIYAIDSIDQFFHVLFHELGHHVYFQIIGSRLKKHWVTRVSRKEKSITAYGARNAAEDFAEYYAAFLLNIDKLKKTSLKYVFFKKQVFNNQCYILEDDRLDIQA